MSIRFAQKPGIEKRDLEGSIVLVKPEVSLYFGVNRVGACIWDTLEHPHSLDELVAIVSQRFDVEAHECRKAIRDFLAQLELKNLIAQL